MRPSSSRSVPEASILRICAAPPVTFDLGIVISRRKPCVCTGGYKCINHIRVSLTFDHHIAVFETFVHEPTLTRTPFRPK
jgi:hypothetical protein